MIDKITFYISALVVWSMRAAAVLLTGAMIYAVSITIAAATSAALWRDFMCLVTILVFCTVLAIAQTRYERGL